MLFPHLPLTFVCTISCVCPIPGTQPQVTLQLQAGSHNAFCSHWENSLFQTVSSVLGQEWQTASWSSLLLARLCFRSLFNTAVMALQSIPSVIYLYSYIEIISWKCSFIYIICPLRGSVVPKAVGQFGGPNEWLLNFHLHAIPSS